MEKLTNVSSRFGYGITGRGRSSVDRSIEEWAREMAAKNAKREKEANDAQAPEVPVSTSQRQLA